MEPKLTGCRALRVLLRTSTWKFLTATQELEPGKFATLVMQLPVQGKHLGNTPRLKHVGMLFEWDKAAVSRSGYLASANLEALHAAVRRWKSVPGAMRLAVLPLSGAGAQYTEYNLSLPRLQGRDVAVVELLAGYELLYVHLAPR
ncbi:hypothetical protein VOLCADRAFT_99032 [Volvox carteri f. nagariensis]|uniref:Uncharacterized protein n=1 Tax=Volvox carteri f. nagariensis TaxID=3068 RepID=D8UGV9_VOLCA|nr:uncharacterized protein VOLCADRAFT_99032 [Volvox carteri f. nagariensis]EFJ41049.1 hypothetical protein VOLCADRAFT_99032 [Volvox carteri f. nagariensis]|eukprot:XP_002957913.1 hypothetical protein VOLCADRAFT_99032 [Volvox carteri f. nagariensis]